MSLTRSMVLNPSEFTLLSTALVRTLDGDVPAALVLVRIAWRCEGPYATDDGWWTAPQVELANETGLSRRQVQRGLALLREQGLIETSESTGFTRTLRYRPNFTDREAPSGASGKHPAVPRESTERGFVPIETLETKEQRQEPTTESKDVVGVVELDHAPARPDIPTGLARSHTWYPHRDAVTAALASDRYMTADDYLDRYITRCRELKKQPSSGEWLTWFLDDDAKSRERVAAARPEDDLFDETGTPKSWKN